MVLTKRWLVFAFLVSACNPPSAKDETGKVDGKLIYNYYCVSCHGLKGNQQAGGSPDLTNSTLDAKSIREKILFGGNGMNAYNTMIKDEEEIDALVEYVKKLRKD